MTEKLYERDSNLKICEATVLECEPAPKGFAVVLDRTVLFPEGGGQLSDTGAINGALVDHVRETKEKIIHNCAAEFPVGSKVTVQVTGWTTCSSTAGNIFYLSRFLNCLAPTMWAST